MFLERNGEPRPISQEDIYSIIGRYDKEGDDCISYEEFEAAILPAKDKQHTNLEEDDDHSRFSTPKKKSNGLIARGSQWADEAYQQTAKGKSGGRTVVHNTLSAKQQYSEMFHTAKKPRVVDVTALFTDSGMSTRPSS